MSALDGSPAAIQATKSVRSNAREADRIVRQRILTDLKGVDLPVHVLVDPRTGRHETALVHTHAQCTAPCKADSVPLGNGLRVSSPGATLAYLARSMDIVALAALMTEALGIYAIAAKTDRSQLALTTLLAQQEISARSQESRLDRIREYCDAAGKRASFLDRRGNPLPWELSFDRHGRPTDLWKRPPLTTWDELQLRADTMRGAAGAQTFSRAFKMARAGSASPLETNAALLMFSGPWQGGEGWPCPSLNRRIDLPAHLHNLAGRTYCCCDQLWLEQKVVVELNGMGYHADRQGFIRQTGRTAALESMGFTVFDISYQQTADLDSFDARMEVLAKRLGLPLQKRTPAFLKRRELLHRNLFARRPQSKAK